MTTAKPATPAPEEFRVTLAEIGIAALRVHRIAGEWIVIGWCVDGRKIACTGRSVEDAMRKLIGEAKPETVGRSEA